MRARSTVTNSAGRAGIPRSLVAAGGLLLLWAAWSATHRSAGPGASQAIAGRGPAERPRTHELSDLWSGGDMAAASTRRTTASAASRWTAPSPAAGLLSTFGGEAGGSRVRHESGNPFGGSASFAPTIRDDGGGLFAPDARAPATARSNTVTSYFSPALVPANLPGPVQAQRSTAAESGSDTEPGELQGFVTAPQDQGLVHSVNNGVMTGADIDYAAGLIDDDGNPTAIEQGSADEEAALRRGGK